MNPSLRSSASCLPYSPLRPRTIGARTMKRVPSGSVITWSMICSIDWPAIGFPQEPYGFSNDIGRTSIPTFQAALVTVSAPSVTIAVPVR